MQKVFGKFLTTGIVTVAFTVCGGMANHAHAIPFIFTRDLPVTFSSTIPGVNVNDIATQTVIADNGGNSAISQTWLVGEISLMTLMAGTYSATYNQPHSIQPFAFTTDGAGVVSGALIFDTDSNNQDIFGVGGGVVLFSNAFRDFNSNEAVISNDGAAGWNVQPFVESTPGVPEPLTATLGLMSLGVLGAATRRRSA
jgi:hypothetical protein